MGMFSSARIGQKPINRTGSTLALIIFGLIGLWLMSVFDVIPDFETPIFLGVLGLGLFVITKFIIAASPKTVTETEDFIFLVIAAVGIIAIFILFPGLVPDYLQASIAQIESTPMVQSIMSIAG